jgi:outer membrane receptor protein involved in Fe transport
MLSVDLDGNVSLRGSQNIRVLINNRPSTITAGSIADALKQIPSDLIKSVEVITSPSARYDAEGSGGIINIITKKNTLEGFSLNVDGSAGIRGSNLGLNGSLRKGKMGFSLGGHGRYGYNVRGKFENEQETYRGDNVTLSTQRADTRNQFLFGRYTLGWDYDINKHNFLTASVQYGGRNQFMRQDGLLTQTYLDGVLDRLRPAEREPDRPIEHGGRGPHLHAHLQQAAARIQPAHPVQPQHPHQRLRAQRPLGRRPFGNPGGSKTSTTATTRKSPCRPTTRRPLPATRCSKWAARASCAK